MKRKFTRQPLSITHGSPALFTYIAFALLSVALYTNVHNVPDTNSQWGSLNESYLLGRVAASRASGLFSYGAMLGRFEHPTYQSIRVAPNIYVSNRQNIQDSPDQQSTALLGNRIDRLKQYHLYPFVIPLPSLLVGIIDRVIGIPSRWILPIFYLMSVVLLSVALALFLRWCWLQFGSLTAWGTLLFLLFCAPLVIGGKNIFFQYGLQFGPMLYTLYYCYGNNNKRILWAWTGLFLLSLCGGVVYTIPVLISALFPLSYYYMIHKWSPQRLFKVIMNIVLSWVAALALMYGIICGLSLLAGIQLSSLHKVWGTYLASITVGPGAPPWSFSLLMYRYTSIPLVTIPIYGTGRIVYFSAFHLMTIISAAIGTILFLQSRVAHGYRPHPRLHTLLRYQHIALAAMFSAALAAPIGWLLLFPNSAILLYPYGGAVWMFTLLPLAGCYLSLMIREATKIIAARK